MVVESHNGFLQSNDNKGKLVTVRCNMNELHIHGVSGKNKTQRIMYCIFHLY